MRVSASILGFWFDAKKKGLNDTEMIKNINSALESHEFDILQFDIADGIFVEEKYFTPSIIAKVKCARKKEVHLMVVDYRKYLKQYLDLGQMFIIHNEVIRHDFIDTINLLREHKKHIGIAVNPETHVPDIKYIDKVDMVLVMSIHPGLPGQEFIDSSLIKVRKLVELRKERKLNFAIEMDGGIKKNNMDRCKEAGADIVVMGTGLFNDNN